MLYLGPTTYVCPPHYHKRTPIIKTVPLKHYTQYCVNQLLTSRPKLRAETTCSLAILSFSLAFCQGSDNIAARSCHCKPDQACSLPGAVPSICNELGNAIFRKPKDVSFSKWYLYLSDLSGYNSRCSRVHDQV